MRTKKRKGSEDNRDQELLRRPGGSQSKNNPGHGVTTRNKSSENVDVSFKQTHRGSRKDADKYSRGA